MVKRITVYTAFGHFIEMVERQAELEMEQKKTVETDRYSIDHPLSDYQNALNSVENLAVKSCPLVVSISNGPPLVQSVSCPEMPLDFTDGALQLAVSPIPTTIETRKLNEATELMMSFWKIHVTSRKPKTENEQRIFSIFEKLDGLFSTASTTSMASIFGKFEGFIEDMKNENEKNESLVWSSPDQPAFPQLPVFVKSPVDSIKFYKRSELKTDGMADDDLTLTSKFEIASSPTSLDLSTNSSLSSSTTVISHASRLVRQIRLQQTIINKQKNLIDDLYKLQTLNRKLSNFRRGL